MPHPGHTEIPSAPAGGKKDLMPRLRGKSCQQRAQIPREGVVDEQDAHGSSRGCCQKAGRLQTAPPCMQG